MVLRLIYLIVIICSVMVSSQDVNAQTVVVQNNSGITSTSSNENTNIKYINGIPSTEDIGGVEVVQEEYPYAKFINYHPFTVTVNYEIISTTGTYNHPITNEYTEVGSIVIPSGQSKTIRIWGKLYKAFTITRKL